MSELPSAREVKVGPLGRRVDDDLLAVDPGLGELEAGLGLGLRGQRGEAERLIGRWGRGFRSWWQGGLIFVAFRLSGAVRGTGALNCDLVESRALVERG